MTSTLGGRNGIDERDLLEASSIQNRTNSDFPIISNFLIDIWSRDAIEQRQIGLEVFHFELLGIEVDVEPLSFLVGHGSCNLRDDGANR